MSSVGPTGCLSGENGEGDEDVEDGFGEELVDVPDSPRARVTTTAAMMPPIALGRMGAAGMVKRMEDRYPQNFELLPLC